MSLSLGAICWGKEGIIQIVNIMPVCIQTCFKRRPTLNAGVHTSCWTLQEPYHHNCIAAHGWYVTNHFQSLLQRVIGLLSCEVCGISHEAPIYPVSPALSVRCLTRHCAAWVSSGSETHLKQATLVILVTGGQSHW